MTFAGLRRELSRYLGVVDVAVDNYYAINHVHALNRGQDVVGMDLHIPNTITSVATVANETAWPATIRRGGLLSVTAEGAFGRRDVSVVNQDEAERLRGLFPSAGPPRMAVPLPTVIRFVPVTGASITYTISGVATNAAMAIDTDTPWGGLHLDHAPLIALYAALYLLQQDGAGRSQERAQALQQGYDRERVEAYLRIHPNRGVAPANLRMALPAQLRSN